MLADVYADSTGPERRRVSVVKLPKSGGVVQRSKKYRQRVQNQHIKVSPGEGGEGAAAAQGERAAQKRALDQGPATAPIACVCGTGLAGPCQGLCGPLA